MPKISKNAFSRYIGSNCDRQLRLYLATREDRRSEDMPAEQPPRPGLEYIAQQGEEWQHEKIVDLSETFGAEKLIADPRVNGGRTTYQKIELRDHLPVATAQLIENGVVSWLTEAQFEFSQTFFDSLELGGVLEAHPDLEFSELRPDLIEVALPGSFEDEVLPDGRLTPIEEGDERVQLRVIDVKLTSEPAANYFAEVALYSMVLAGWLRDESLSDEFVVVGKAALWSGSHEASNLLQAKQAAEAEGLELSTEDLRTALREDLDEVPFEVFAPRVRKFFQHDVPEVLSKDWRDLDWHVDNKCKSCSFVGAPWKRGDGTFTWDSDRRHCIQQAEDQEHLSRVADVTNGARVTIERAGITQVSALGVADLEHAMFGQHHVLRGTRDVMTTRARSFADNQSVLVENSGTSATMPKWVDLRFEISVDFEISSAISVAFGAQWVAWNPETEQPILPQPRGPRVFLVSTKSLDSEYEQFKAFLEFIHDALQTVAQAMPEAKVQFFIWDKLELKHLSRVAGRHLDRLLDEPALRDLAWLFPPEELLTNPGHATRNSPITVVRDVVRSHVAAPIAHYYSLLEIAREYHPADLPENLREFDVHPLFEDPLSDQIPSERAHEIWSRSARPPWGEQAGRFTRAVQTRLRALEAVRRRLSEDLRGTLRAAAPRLRIGALAPVGGMAVDSELLHAFARLDSAVNALDVDQIRAMSPLERESKFRSARLTQRLGADAEGQHLAQIGIAHEPNVRVYRIPDSSKEVRAREGDIGFAVSPESSPGLLDQPVKRIVEGTSLDTPLVEWQMQMSKALEVSILDIDRDQGLITVKFQNFLGGVQLRNQQFIQQLETEVGLNLTSDLMLDPVHVDFFTRRLREALKAIKTPPSAVTNPHVQRALGDQRPNGPRTTADVPAADFLWEASDTHSEVVERDFVSLKASLEAAGIRLNDSQWAAWEAALGHRLQTIWGPPGTGKSQTLRALVYGAVMDADRNGRGLRVLVCTHTYNALDNLFRRISAELPELAAGDVEIHRLRSRYRTPAEWVEELGVDHVVQQNSVETEALRDRLADQSELTVVGSVPQQVHQLLQAGGAAMAELFDLVVFDEASQLDVGNAVLALCSVADGAQVVVAGDPLQLPPIHQATPPLGLEDLVGSVYSYYEKHHGIEASPLLLNYRSNSDIVGFARAADYPRSLASFRPELQVRLEAAPGTRPENWPQDVVWSSELEAVADASPSVCSFVYDDENWSSQWNHFEASVVVGVLSSLRRRMFSGLGGDLDHEGNPIEPSADHVNDEEFWTRCVGVVTPHRAQQALVVSRLQRAFPETDPGLIRGAVDTVERFQGQERDVIVVSYALGDPDAIRDEDEFLLGAKRFNVAASRARAKLIVLVSEQVAEHLSHEVEVMNDSRMLKLYIDSYCSNHRAMTLDYANLEGEVLSMSGEFKWH